MGIYYDVFNLDKKESFCGHDIGVCIKFNSTFNGVIPKVLARLLAQNGRWHGDRIKILGDEQPAWEELMDICKECPTELKEELDLIMEDIKGEETYELSL